MMEFRPPTSSLFHLQVRTGLRDEAVMQAS